MSEILMHPSVIESADAHRSHGDTCKEHHHTCQLKASPSFCLLGADYENPNLGVRALTLGAITAVYAAYPTASLYMLEYHRHSNEYHFDIAGMSVTTRMQNIRYSKKPWTPNHIAHLIVLALIRRIFGIHSVSKNPWLRSLIATDYVLSLNAGDSFSDIYGLGDFIYVALPQVLAILLGKPIVQLPQTLGPFNSFASRHVAAFILRHSAKIFLRGEELVEEIRSLLPPSHRHKVCFCNDLAFVIHAKPFSRPDVESAFGSRPVIGFNVSGLIYSSACSGSNRFGLILDYRELVERSIAFFIDNAGANVILVPHFVGDGDFAACLEIYRGMEKAYRGRLFIARPSYDEGEIKSLIARCDFFVGARMHACIGALSQCVPAVAMAYSMKFIGVFSSVGVDGAVLDLRDTSLDQAIDLLRTQFESRAVLKSTLLERVPRAQRMVLEIVKGLDQLINPNASRVGRQ